MQRGDVLALGGVTAAGHPDPAVLQPRGWVEVKVKVKAGLGLGSSGRGRQCARPETSRLRGGSERPERNSAGSSGAEGEVGDALCQLGWGA